MQVRLFTGWSWNAELRLSVSYMPGVNTGFGSSSGTEVCACAAADAMKAAQAHDKSTRGVLRAGASRCRSLLLRLRLGPREWPRCARAPRGRTAGFFMPDRCPLWVKGLNRSRGRVPAETEE